MAGLLFYVFTGCIFCDSVFFFFFFFQAEDGIRDLTVTGVQTCALPICVGVIMLVAALITGFDYNIQENIKQYGVDTAFISRWSQGMHGNPPLEERLRKIGRASCRERV